MQRDWIGRSEGAEVQFGVDGRSDGVHASSRRAPTRCSAAPTSVLAPEHPLVAQITTADAARRGRGLPGRGRQAQRARPARRRRRRAEDRRVHRRVRDQPGQRRARSRSGSPTTCSRRTAPARSSRARPTTSATTRSRRRFDLPIVEVVPGGDVDEAAYTGDGPHVNSGFLDGLDVATAKKAVDRVARRAAGRAAARSSYRLRDWLFSRQRYWGEPFPMILTDGRRRSRPLPD